MIFLTNTSGIRNFTMGVWIHSLQKINHLETWPGARTQNIIEIQFNLGLEKNL